MTALARIRPAERPRAPAAKLNPANDLGGIVRILTCGSVDDGKSTLIGRLLWDASDLFEDQREALRRSGRRVLDGRHLDYSLLVDGLLAEREQGITIDIAWRYFDSADRRFVIIDSPGHEQYTRNMASGASHADVAVMLIDARHGIKRQTRRHAAILDLFGIRRVVLAVNKMDLVDWSEARFRAIETDFKALTRKFGFDDAAAIPVAAVTGDNIARRSEAMRWYAGSTLVEHVAHLPAAGDRNKGPFRMPVQTVLRDGQDFRGLAGTITSGAVRRGDTVTDAVSGQGARVARIATMSGDLEFATRGQAVALVLDADIDVSRGAVLAPANAAPVATRAFEGRFVWFAETPFDTAASYLLRTATDTVPVARIEIRALLDLETMAQAPSTTCAVNDIAVATLRLGRPTAVDRFADLPATGSFVLVDAVTGATVAGGIVAAREANDRGAAATTFRLTRDLLARGVCADLGAGSDDRAEFRRRADQVASLLRSAGVEVEIELGSFAGTVK